MIEPSSVRNFTIFMRNISCFEKGSVCKSKREPIFNFISSKNQRLFISTFLGKISIKIAIDMTPYLVIQIYRAPYFFRDISGILYISFFENVTFYEI